MFQPIEYKHHSSKAYIDEFPVAYKQWKADSHCNKNHGYSFSIIFHFGANSLDKRGWVVDFGSLKPLKETLKEMFDHKTIVAEDDPDLPFLREMEKRGIMDISIFTALGCEKLADQLYKYMNGVFIPETFGKEESERIWCYKVEVHETQTNAGARVGHREWNEDLFN